MRDWVSKVVVAVMVAILLSGCSYTLSEVRTKEPSYTITSTKTPQDLSKCIEFKMREMLLLGVNREEHENNTYRVSIIMSSPYYATAIADILVKPKDNGSVVEFRRKDYYMVHSEWLEAINRCAQ